MLLKKHCLTNLVSTSPVTDLELCVCVCLYTLIDNKSQQFCQQQGNNIQGNVDAVPNPAGAEEDQRQACRPEDNALKTLSDEVIIHTAGVMFHQFSVSSGTKAVAISKCISVYQLLQKYNVISLHES